MRLVLVSDIHADFLPDSRRAFVLGALGEAMARARPDVVVVAGDVANKGDLVPKALAHLAVGRKANLYVPGNHDVWRTPAEIRAARSSFGALSLLAAKVGAAGFHYLPGHPLTVKAGPATWGFAGSLGWYDYSFRAPSLVVAPGAYQAKTFGAFVWNDRDRASWRDRAGVILGDPEMSARFASELDADLRKLGLDERGGGPPTVAVTHMLAYASQVLYKGVPDWDFFSAFMGAARYGDLYDRFPSLRAAFMGHTHTPRLERRPSGLLTAVAPIGYWATAEFPRDLDARIAVFETKGRSLEVVSAPR
jgi:predicted phosphodiesterase